MMKMDEGFPIAFQTDYSTVGNPILAKRIIEMLNQNGIKAKAENNRSLDHSALIPLMLLFQITQHYYLDPEYHKRIAEILNPPWAENKLFIGSGGLVHYRIEIQKFGDHKIAPYKWAKEFEDFITHELTDQLNTNYTNKINSAYNHKLFLKSHPSSEHFLSLVFVAAFGGQATKIYEAFQWKNLSISAFKFE